MVLLILKRLYEMVGLDDDPDKNHNCRNMLSELLLNFVAFFHVASLFVREVENRKVGVDNKKALELTNSSVFHRGRQQKSSRADKWNGFLII